MKAIHKHNGIYNGADGRKSLYDLEVPEAWSGKLIVFTHGLMGFKDWGAWNLVSAYFCKLGFAFLKYNLSHNGATTAVAEDFPDKEAFSKDTYSKQCNDLRAILDLVEKLLKPLPEICLIGHSKGGAISLLTLPDPRVAKVATWASISSIEERFPTGQALQEWKEKGFRILKNGRTGDELKVAYDEYLDFQQNRDKLMIQSILEHSEKPVFIAHGAEDKSVSPENGKKLAKWSGTKLSLIPETAHTFGSYHPYDRDELPPELLKLCRETARFFLH